MKLLQLKSNNPNFKTLSFNSGLNIVAGLQLSKNDRKTINGLGKSLALHLIHLMFGSTLNPKKPKQKKLKMFLERYGYFTLTIQHNDSEYEIIKDFSRPEFFINGEKILKKNYSKRLSELFLEEEKGVSFKQVLNCFARRYGGGDFYNDPLGQQGQPLNDYNQRFVNLELLHIETDLVTQTYIISEKISKLNQAEHLIKEYQEALDKTNLKDLKDEYEKLLIDKSNFIIAKNYNEMKIEADKLTIELNEMRNRIQKNRDLLQKKNTNLLASENINIDSEEIDNLFKEANFFLKDKVVNRLEKTQEFHNELVLNRKKRIEIEVMELKLEKENLFNQQNGISTKRDELLKVLNSSGAFEEYDSIRDRINYLNDEIKKLEKYEETLSDFKKSISTWKLKKAVIREKSILYLEKEKKKHEEIEDKFREIVKNFYDNSGGTLKLRETKTARYLYDIFIEIPRSSSQGIGEVEIFCYDVLLYKLNKNVLNFLAHDGCIFSEMDPRQKASIFKIIIELTHRNGLQYFVNIGENSLNDVLNQELLSEDEKNIINNNIILKLYDKDPKNCLMGETFD